MALTARQEADAVRYRKNKEQIRAAQTKYREANREKLNAAKRAQRQADPEADRARCRAYRAANREARRAYNAAYYAAKREEINMQGKRYRDSPEGQAKAKDARAKRHQENPEIRTAKWAQRKARALRACPAWADRRALREVYRQRDALTRQTGHEHHVDHIVPLVHPKVSGLHVPANLRVLPATENLSKGNRHWPDMPEGE